MEAPVRKPLIVGNWKMFNNITDSIKLVTALKNLMGESSEVETVVAPPFTSLYSVSVAIQDTPMKLAAQNCFWEDEGPFTGEVSALFLKDVGCEYVILGHSERREHFGETDELINKKIHAALASELIPIFCIGETAKDRREGKTFAVLEQQLRKGLTDVNMHDLENFVIAYEPVWAIGTGDTATPVQMAEAHAHIRNYVAKLYDAPTANGIRLLYGGSVKAENIAEILEVPQVDGALVGGASLDPEQFAKIINFGEMIKN
ncbi:MAG: triose-phosphate isomerase [bacterium]